MNQQNMFGYILVCMHIYIYLNICTISITITSCNSVFVAENDLGIWALISRFPVAKVWHGNVSSVFENFEFQKHLRGYSNTQWNHLLWGLKWELNATAGHQSFQSAPLKIHLQLTLPWNEQQKPRKIDAWKTRLYVWGRPIFRGERFVLGSVGTWLHSKHVFIFFIFAPSLPIRKTWWNTWAALGPVSHYWVMQGLLILQSIKASRYQVHDHVDSSDSSEFE